MAGGSINQLIDPEKRVAVLRTCFVKIGVVNTHSPISIGLFNQYNVSELLEALHFTNKPRP